MAIFTIYSGARAAAPTIYTAIIDSEDCSSTTGTKYNAYFEKLPVEEGDIIYTDINLTIPIDVIAVGWFRLIGDINITPNPDTIADTTGKPISSYKFTLGANGEVVSVETC